MLSMANKTVLYRQYCRSVMRICDQWHTVFIQTLHDSILSRLASIVSVRGPPWIHFEPLQLLKFCFDADADPTPSFDFNADPDPDPAYHSDVTPDPDSIL